MLQLMEEADDILTLSWVSIFNECFSGDSVVDDASSMVSRYNSVVVFSFLQSSCIDN